MRPQSIQSMTGFIMEVLSEELFCALFLLECCPLCFGFSRPRAGSPTLSEALTQS